MNKKVGSGLIMLALAVVVFLPWTFRAAKGIYDTFRLLSQGEVTQARVINTRTRFVESWPYRVEYRFEVGGNVYEEPMYYGGLGKNTGYWSSGAQGGLEGGRRNRLHLCFVLDSLS